LTIGPGVWTLVPAQQPQVHPEEHEQAESEAIGVLLLCEMDACSHLPPSITRVSCP
jgi:hypothetical protein